MSQVDDLALEELRPFHQMKTDAELAQSWSDKFSYESHGNALNPKTTDYGSSRRINHGNTFGFSTPGRLVSSALSPIVEREDIEVALVAPMHLRAFFGPGVVRYFDLRHLFGQELSPASNFPGKPSSRTMRGLRPGAVLPVPGRSVASEFPRRSPSTHSPFLPASSCTPIPLRRSANNYPAERVCRELASKLPILGATLTQEIRRVRTRDKVVVPMPYPRAWPETVRYLSSGQPDFLSEAVRCNISNLGGRVLMAHSAL
ncbi:unnamed protein product, partial [Clonostachys chloroleuca]